MPPWLAPKQAVNFEYYGQTGRLLQRSCRKLKNKGFRASSDLRNEKIGFKIREHTLQKIPYLLVVGDKEVENGTVAVRKRGGEDLGAMTFDEFCTLLNQDVANFGRSA